MAALVATILSHEPDLARAEIGSEPGHTQSLLHRAIPAMGTRSLTRIWRSSDRCWMPGRR
jgi:hypothetical protein